MRQLRYLGVFLMGLAAVCWVCWADEEKEAAVKSNAMTLGKIHIVEVGPGEDVLATISKRLVGQGIRQAVVIGGYGTMAAYHVHWVQHNRIPPESTKGRAEGGFEILSMNGLVVEGKPHIHVTLSNKDGAFGGHLEEGCTAYVLCQVFVAELDGPNLSYERTRVDVPKMGTGDVWRLVYGKKDGQ